MTDYETANHRLTTATAWLVGISAILLVLSVEVFVLKGNTSQVGAISESATVVLLLLSIVIHFADTRLLASVYTGEDVSPELAIKRAIIGLRLAISLTFWGLGGLMLVAFDVTTQGLVLSIFAVVSPFLTPLIFRLQRM